MNRTRTRLRGLKDRDTRRLIAVIIGGKMLGIVAILGMIKGVAWYFDAAASAQTAPIVHQANDFVSPVNTIWVLVTAFLVFFMQAGFMGLEAGFPRMGENRKLIFECGFDTWLCGGPYWGVGLPLPFRRCDGLLVPPHVLL